MYRAFKHSTSEALLRNKANRNGMAKKQVFFSFKDDISRLMKMVLMKIYELTKGLFNFVLFYVVNICYRQSHVIQ